MRKLLLILICLCLLLGNVFAASDEVTKMEAQITVNDNGTCQVTVTAEVRFSTRPTTFRLPLGADAGHISASGASYRTRTMDGVKCVIFENKSGFNGTQTFQCSYSLPCTMWETSSGQHFRAMLPAQGMDLPINRFSMTIDFPTDITAFPQWSSAYYGDVIDNYLTIQIKENTVTAKSNIVFRDHETLSMELAFAPATFTLWHLAEQTVSFDRLAFFLLYLACIVYWFVALRKRRVRSKSDPLFHFQSSAGEVPCQLYCTKADMVGIIAHWGNLGYILLRRNKRGVFRLEKQMDMGNERSTAERRLFHSIFRSTDSVEVPGNRFFAAVDAEGSVLIAHWKRRMFQQKDGKPKILLRLSLAVGLILSLMIFDILLSATPGRWFWLVVLPLLSLPLHWVIQQMIPRFYRPERWLFVGLGAVSILILYLLAVPAECGVYLFFHILLQLGVGYATRFGGQRTLPGIEQSQELLRLRKFVLRSDRNSASQCVRSDSQYFYRLLPYAEIMGVGKRFHKHFGAATTESCPWLIDEKMGSGSSNAFYLAYTELAKALRAERTMGLFRSLRSELDHISLPRIRPGSPSDNRRTGTRRGNSYTNRARRPAPHSRSGNRPTVRAGQRSTYRTQHHPNPNHTGRRS